MDNPSFNIDDVQNTKDSNFNNSTNSSVVENKTFSKEVKLSYLRQIICATVVTSGLYVLAFGISTTSFLPLFLNTYSNNTNYTSEDLNWLASAPVFISFSGNFCGAFLSERFGPTFVFRISLLLCVLLYIIQAFYRTLTVLWIIRVSIWMNVGILNIICIPLVALLSEPNVRGLCGALPDLTTSFGMLLAFISFTYLDPTYAIVVNAVPIFLGFIGSLYVPESPFWLIQHGKLSEAERSISRVIGPARKIKREEMFKEILSLYKTNKEEEPEQINKSIPIKSQILLLGKTKNWKPIILSIVVFAFREFGGNTIIFFYALTIFEAANISIDAFLCTIIVSVARVLSTFISACFQDKFGRRVILIGTSIISAICLISSGIILFFDIKLLKLLPLIGIIIFILMTGVGMGPVPYMIMGEVIPSEIKFLGTAIVYSFIDFSQFTIVNVMPSIISYFNIGTIFIAFSLINFAISFILYFILPETKGKTFSEIEDMFK